MSFAGGVRMSLRRGRVVRRQRGRLVSAIVGACVALNSAPAAPVDPPVRVSTTTADKSKVAGRVTAFDDAGFDVLDAKDAARRVAWADLPARNAIEVYGLLLAKGTAADWLAAGRVLGGLPEGKP